MYCGKTWGRGVTIPMGAHMSDQHEAINQAVNYIHHNLHMPLSLPALARHVAYSPYHFSRMFKERLGLSPLYYVSSVRLQNAKKLLLHTNLSIRQVALEVGQQSLGTFTTRFTEKVGVTPVRFRDSEPQAQRHLELLRGLNDWRDEGGMMDLYRTVSGTVYFDGSFEGVILIGLFPKPIPEGIPLYGTLLPGPGHFRFSDVKPGTYYLMATSVPWTMHATGILLPETTLRTRAHRPIQVEPYTPVPWQHVKLYPPQIDDPPILISLPLLMNRFINRVTQNSNL